MEIITAKEACAKAVPHAIAYAMEKINEYANKGCTRCYVSNNENRPPVAMIKHLVDLGYDIHFSNYKRDDHWFVQADWSSKACGKIFNNSTFASGDEMSLEDFINLLSGNNN